MLAENMAGGVPILIRSYEALENEGPRCTIKEAARATTATPGLFKPVTIIDQGLQLSYVDAGFGTNNPTACMLAEAERVFPDRGVSTIISIGSGRLSSVGISQYSSARRLGLKLLTDGERVAQELARRFQNTTNLYFRFNVEQGLQRIGPGSWDRMGDIIGHTRQYIQTSDTHEKLTRAIKSISNHVEAGVPTSQLNGTLAASENLQPLKESPSPSPVFTGRVDALAQMCNSIFDGSGARRVFVLHGLGGSGKTQIALKFVDMYKERFSNVFYIDASSSTTIRAGLKHVALAKRYGSTSDDTIAWLTGCSENWLIVYNNADDAKLDIQSYIPPCSHGNIIITTRNKNAVVHAQGTQSCYQVSGMLPSDAKELLLKTAHITADEGMEEVAAKVAKELGYLALAVVHAGAYICVHECTLLDYLTMYQDYRLKLLEEYRNLVQKIDDYDETIYTTWRVSYQKLRPNTVLLLQILAFIHHEGITEETFRRANQKFINPKSMEFTLVQAATSDEALNRFMLEFRTDQSSWYRPSFLNAISDARSYSLIEYNSTNESYSIHPLVHSWIHTTVEDIGSMSKRAATLLALSIDRNQDFRDVEFRSTLVSHVNALSPELRSQPSFARQFSFVYFESGQWEMAEKLQELVVESDRHTLGDNDLMTLTDMHELAMIYQVNGRFKDAEALQTHVVESRAHLLGASHEETTRALAYLSITYQYQCRYQEAEAIQLKVLEEAKRLLGPEARETLMTMHALATSYSIQGRLSEAVALQTHVLATETKTLGPKHPTTLMTLFNLVSHHKDLGNLELAERLITRYIDSYTKLFGKYHPDTLKATDLLAQIYFGQNRIHEAEHLQRETLEFLERTLGNKHMLTLTTKGNLGSTYLTRGRLSEAETIILGVYEARKELLAKEHSDNLSSIINLAALYREQGRVGDAEHMMREELDFRLNVSSNKAPATTWILINNLANLYALQGRCQEAAVMQEKVVSLQMTVFGAQHPKTVSSVRTLAEMQWNLKKARWSKLAYPALSLLVVVLASLVFRMFAL
ncbi:nephrocystin-3 protein [Ceratobasidium sp. AG-Ba]|nr:nephrocystin-3 protein [Ceratobasidium sp. AG-Ba]